MTAPPQTPHHSHNHNDGHGYRHAELIRPRPLRPGGTIGVWTPSSPAPALFPRRFGRALDALRQAGYQVVTTPSCERSNGINAAAPRVLAAELHALLADDAVDAVVCAAGGYSTLPVLGHLDWQLLRDAAKPLVGYSDVTSLLWGALARSGLMTFHGPMVVSEWGEHGGPWPYTLHHFQQAVAGRAGDDATVLGPPSAWTDEVLWWDAEDHRPRTPRPAGNWRMIVPGDARGWLLPGCLPTVSRLFGTPYLPRVDGAILCLEALETGPDELWGLLAQWDAAGLLDRIAGLVLGRHFRPSRAAAGSDDFDAVILDVLNGRPLPVLADVDFGHTEPRLTLPVGAPARIDGDAATLTLLHPAPSNRPLEEAP